MSKKRILCVGIIASLLIGLFILLGVILHRQEQRDTEHRNIIEGYYGENEVVSMLDYKYGTEDSFISLVLLYRQESHDTDANIVVVTDAGKGNISFGTGTVQLTYLEEDGIKLIANDTIAVSFLNDETGEIWDYQLQCTLNNDTDMVFKASSELRET